MEVVVIGGTGLIGSKLVQQLRLAGHVAIAAARSTGVDTVAGTGLDAVMDGADVVVDVSNPGYSDAIAMLAFFETSGANLLAAERKARVPHHVTFSALGAGQVNDGFYVAKAAQEALVVASGTPFTIVRSTPLFEYIDALVDAGRDRDIVCVPPLLLRPTAADDAVTVLMRIALAMPKNAIVEVSGPNIYRLATLVEQVLTANEDYREVVQDDAATFFGAPVDGLSLIGSGPPRTDATNFEDWLKRSLVPADQHHLGTLTSNQRKSS